MTHQPSEFDIIRRYFEGLSSSSHKGTILSVGDDCALLSPPSDELLCLSMDTMVEGTHFPKNAPAYKLATRAMGAALSDLAAMGAKPAFFTLSLTLPEFNETWLAEFSAGLRAFSQAYDIDLVGGDTTRGPLTIAIQVHGYLKKENAMRRDAAKEGDLILVTGTLGDAGAALDFLDRTDCSLSSDEKYLMDRYYGPVPRVKESLAISKFAHACIDVSDGLVADARHIAERSQVSMHIDIDRLPISAPLNAIKGIGSVALALGSGDDYELLLTLNKDRWLDVCGKSIPSLDEKTDVQFKDLFTVIGEVRSGEPDVIIKKGGHPYKVSQEGYKHFG